MIRVSLLALFSTLIIGGFCVEDFVSYGRHSWRCNGKVEYEKEATVNVIPAMKMPLQECLPVKSYKTVKCCCGKVYKGPFTIFRHQTWFFF